MGKLVEGQWVEEDVNPKTEDGGFHRQEQSFREKINSTTFPAEPHRYHLFVSYACPWAHRTLIARKLKGLENIIDYSVVHPHMLEHGWSFDKNFPDTTGDKISQKNYLKDIYTEADPNFTGKVTVPVLFCTKTKKIVNNESSEILRIFNSAFTEFENNEINLYPESLQEKIDGINSIVYENINNGVYKVGFARKQEAYEHNFHNLFDALDHIEGLLEERKYLAGDQLTEADIRLYTTLVRFDPVYYVHFKCNYKRIKDYKSISSYLHRLFSIDPFKETTFFNHIKEHYYFSHKNINPYQIVPLGPKLDL